MATLPGSNLPDNLFGTIDADVIDGLLADDILHGFDGNDRLRGGDGDDLIYGGSGDDTLDGGAGEDQMFGGSGIDTVSYASATAPVGLVLGLPFLSTGDALGDTFLSIERFVLSGLGDSFLGTAASETVLGGGGGDTLSGSGGNDLLSGDAGNDVLNGGVGADTLQGGAGFDLVSYVGSTFGLVLNFATGSLDGEAAGDVMTSIEGVIGGLAGDSLTLGNGLTFASGSEGNDTLLGSALADVLVGDIGNDQLSGGNGADLLLGGHQNDLLQGGAGNDSLSGEEGNDTLLGGLGADAFDGGNGTDRVDYATRVRVDMLNPATNTGEALGDTFTGIETIRFLAPNSTWVGGAQAMRVEAAGLAIAGTGAEFLFNPGRIDYSRMTLGIELSGAAAGNLLGLGGASGDEIVVGSQLTLVATSRADILDLTNFGPVTLDLSLGSGNDGIDFAGLQGRIDTGGGQDLAEGSINAGSLAMGGGHDVLRVVYNQADVSSLLDGGEGNDLIEVTNSWGTITGGDGQDTIQGSGFNGLIQGGLGHDLIDVSNLGLDVITMDGGIGNDTIHSQASGSRIDILGGDGDDSLTGEALGATVSGGSGNDRIDVQALTGNVTGGDGNDKISLEIIEVESGSFLVDAGAGDDLIEITSLNVGSVSSNRRLEFEAGSGNDQITSDGTSTQLLETFVFRTGWGEDLVKAFDLSQDLLRFVGVAGLDEFSDLTISGDSGATLVSFGGNSVLLDGVDVATFNSAMTEFA